MLYGGARGHTLPGAAVQPSLEQFLDHPGHARLFAGGEVAERDDAVSALSQFELDFINLSIL
jgi:hypothetical protein